MARRQIAVRPDTLEVALVIRGLKTGDTPGRLGFRLRFRGCRSVRSSTYVDLHGSTVSVNVFSLPVGQKPGGKFPFCGHHGLPRFSARTRSSNLPTQSSASGLPLRLRPLSSVQMRTPLTSLSVGQSLRSPWGSTLASLTRWLFFPSQDVSDAPSQPRSGAATRSEDLVTFP